MAVLAVFLKARFGDVTGLDKFLVHGGYNQMDITAKVIRRSFWAAVIGLLAIQVIPYGHNHTNQPTVKEPAWDSPATRALVKRACFNCHSNETEWPWYSRIAPASWLVYHDVIKGRSLVNFSDWQGGTGAEFQRVITAGYMPPLQYRLAHPEARLTPAEKQQLIKGLTATAAAGR